MFKRKKPSEHPTITYGRYHTQDGNIYIQRDDGIWRQNVNYLAGVPTQYNCTTYKEQFEKIIRHIENGKLRATYASTLHYKMVDGKLYRFNEKTPQNATFTTLYILWLLKNIKSISIQRL